MSLLSEAMETCTMLDKRTVDDGYGGYRRVWTLGVSFQAAIVFENSIEARLAQEQGVSSLYTVTTGREMTLEYHDVFLRTTDNKIFRVTSDGDDKYTPKSAGLNMRQVSAEEWAIPPDEVISNGQVSGS